LVALIFLVCSGFTAVGAQDSNYTEPDSNYVDQNTNYMAQIISAIAVGDLNAAQDLNVLRDAKIDALGLDNLKINIDDLNLLAKIIYWEAGSEWLSDDWKMCAGEVVLNRVASPEFPDTIKDVVYQRGQYAGVTSNSFKKQKPDELCVSLALRLLEGERVLNTPSVIFQANFRQGSGVYLALYDKHLGWTYFCYSLHPELYANN